MRRLRYCPADGFGDVVGGQRLQSLIHRCGALALAVARARLGFPLATPALALASGTVSVSEWLGLAMCGLWLVLSYYSWSGPTAPEHVQTRPAPLEVMEGRR